MLDGALYKGISQVSHNDSDSEVAIGGVVKIFPVLTPRSLDIASARGVNSESFNWFFMLLAALIEEKEPIYKHMGRFVNQQQLLCGHDRQVVLRWWFASQN